MGYVAQRHWLDDEDTDYRDRIGEHEGFIDLVNADSGDCVDKGSWWGDVFEGAGESGEHAAVESLRLVPRCTCGWTGGQYHVVHGASGEIDYDRSEDGPIEQWVAGHVEALRTTAEADRTRREALAGQLHGGHLVALDVLAAMPPMERLGAITTVRKALAGLEFDAVIAARRERPQHSWTAIGAELGVSKQAVRERYGKHVPESGNLIAGSDAHAARILSAVTELSEAIPPDARGFDWATPAKLAGPIARTLAALSGNGSGLVPAAQELLTVLNDGIAPEDTGSLRTIIRELSDAVGKFQRSRAAES